MKHGVFFFFFFFLTPLSLFSVWGRGLWGWAGRPVGVWAVGFLCCCGGPGWSSCPRAGAKGVQLRDRALTTPLGVVVPGSRSIECIWGVWVWGTVSIFVCLHVGRRCEYSFACMRVGTLLVYMVLVVYVYVSGRALDSASLIILVDPHPTTMPCRWRMPPVRWWFLAPGQDARASAGPLSAVDWRGLALLGPDWGWGAFGSPGPGPGPPWVVAAGGACGLAATAPWGAYTVAVGGRLRALLCPFLGGGRGCPCGGSPGGPVPWGSGCLGPGSFPCLLQALRDGAVVPHTHTSKHLHGGTLWTQARSHTQVYTQASHWCKTGAHRHTLLDLLLLQNLFCNIS